LKRLHKFWSFHAPFCFFKVGTSATQTDETDIQTDGPIHNSRRYYLANYPTAIIKFDIAAVQCEKVINETQRELNVPL